MKRISATVVITILLLLASAVAGRASSNDGMTKIYQWCISETVDTERMPTVCVELLTSSLLDELKTLIRILGLVDADGKFVQRPVWEQVLKSAGECVHTAFVQQFDSFDYSTVVGCVTSAVETYAPLQKR